MNTMINLISGCRLLKFPFKKFCGFSRVNTQSFKGKMVSATRDPLRYNALFLNDLRAFLDKFWRMVEGR
jgi:hypothetical protein